MLQAHAQRAQGYEDSHVGLMCGFLILAFVLVMIVRGSR